MEQVQYPLGLIYMSIRKGAIENVWNLETWLDKPSVYLMESKPIRFIHSQLRKSIAAESSLLVEGETFEAHHGPISSHDTFRCT